MHIQFFPNSDEFDSIYSAIGSTRSGDIYVALCTHLPNKSAAVYRYDEKSNRLESTWKLSDLLPIKQGLSHGKIHTPLLDDGDGWLHFGTHFAYPHGIPQKVEYEGGRIVSVRTDSSSHRVSEVIEPGEGLVSMTFDKERGLAYVLTAASGNLWRYDVNKCKKSLIGHVANNKSICRDIVVDEKGRVFGSFEPNGIFVFDPLADELITYEAILPSAPVDEWMTESRQGVNRVGRQLWRTASYDQTRDCIFAVHAATSRLLQISCSELDVTQLCDLFPTDTTYLDSVYPTLSLSQGDFGLAYAPARGFFDYSRSYKLSGASQLHRIHQEDLRGDMRTSTPIELQTDHGKFVGVGASISSNDSIYLAGAFVPAEPEPSKEIKADGDELRMINGKRYELAVAKVSST